SGPLLGIAIADVAGKGLPAALLMSNLQAAVRAFAQNAAEPAGLCGYLNRLLCRHMVSGRVATFCFAWCDADRHTNPYANAGHNPPLLVRGNGNVDRLGDGGTVLGVFAEAAYQQTTISLDPGDRLLFYTDGITEARSPAGEEFGEERLARVASELDAPSAET